MHVEHYAESTLVTDSDGVPVFTDTPLGRRAAALGLSGQTAYLTSAHTAVPYRRMTKAEFMVYSINFPACTALKAYADDLVPSEVLDIIEHVLPQLPNGIDDLEVWHPHAARVQEDPLLVWREIVPSPTRWNENATATYYRLVARWGTALLPYADLEARARAHVERAMRQHVQRVRAALVTFKNSIPVLAGELLETGELSYTLRSFPDFSMPVGQQLAGPSGRS
jgi:hypothetical protein